MSKAANPKKLNKDLAAFCKELHVSAPADKDMDKMVTSINKAKDSLGVRGNQGAYDDMINTFFFQLPESLHLREPQPPILLAPSVIRLLTDPQLATTGSNRHAFLGLAQGQGHRPLGQS